MVLVRLSPPGTLLNLALSFNTVFCFHYVCVIYLLGRHATIVDKPPALFALVIFRIVLHVSPWGRPGPKFMPPI
jgi:hypothetical protein